MERRQISGDIELRIEEKGISGYAAIFDSISLPLGGFQERIAPGAFTAALGKNPDVRALFNHDQNFVLGRTSSGTLKLAQTAKGLRFEVPSLPDTSYARDMREMMTRGDVTQCSFGFTVPQGGDTWAEEMIDGKKTLVRTLRSIGQLLDVGPVAFPAYTATEVSFRDARKSLETWQRNRGYPLDLAWLDLLAKS